MYRLLHTLRNDGEASLIPEVCFHPNGSFFAVSLRDSNEVRLLDAKSLEVRRIYRNPEAQLNMPHGILVTENHVIMANRHQLERPTTFTVHRLDAQSTAPVFTFDTPLGHLRECHSMDIHNNIIACTYTLSEDRMGAMLSYYFDDNTGEMRGPIEAVQAPFETLGEPKGIAFSANGRQAYITFNAEKPPRGIEKLVVDLFKLRDVVASSGLRGLAQKFRQGRSTKYNSSVGKNNGVTVFDIDEQGNFSAQPTAVLLREEFCRLENIHIQKDVAAVTDTINNQVHLYNLANDPNLTNPFLTISEGLSQPHGVNLSPDGVHLVVTNFGLRTYREHIHWGHFRKERRDNVMVFELEPSAALN